MKVKAGDLVLATEAQRGREWVLYSERPMYGFLYSSGIRNLRRGELGTIIMVDQHNAKGVVVAALVLTSDGLGWTNVEAWKHQT